MKKLHYHEIGVFKQSDSEGYPAYRIMTDHHEIVGWTEQKNYADLFTMAPRYLAALEAIVAAGRMNTDSRVQWITEIAENAILNIDVEPSKPKGVKWHISND